MENGLEARVLVCDPNNMILQGVMGAFSKKFGSGEMPFSWNVDNMRKLGVFQYCGVEFVLTNNLDESVSKVRENPAYEPPKYSLMIYESGQVEREIGSAGKISKIKRHDPFMPQMVVGAGLDTDLNSRCARAGAVYSAQETKALIEWVTNIFRSEMQNPGLVVGKYGGSADDFDLQNPNSWNTETLCQILAEIQKEGQSMIITSGAGQRGEIIKSKVKKYVHNPRFIHSYPKNMAKALEDNLEDLQFHFGSNAKFIKTGAFYLIDKKLLSKNVVLLATPPHWICVKYQIPLQDSDTQTLAIAEFYGAEVVILFKRTPGLFDFDPYRGYPLGLELPDSRLLKKLVEYNWRWAQRNNKMHQIGTATQLLEGGISREGTGKYGRPDNTEGHLMEDSSLRYMIEKCKKVKEIRIVHIAPEEMYYKVRDNKYRHVVTGEYLVLGPKGWKGVLEENVRNAFKGISPKIINDKLVYAA